MAMIMLPAASAAAAASVLALLVLTSLQPHAAQAQVASSPWAAPAPWPGELDCTGALLNLSSCLTYVEYRSTLTRPDKGCCGALAGVVDGEAACLCGLVGGYGAYGVRVDAVRALALPTICRVDAPRPGSAPRSVCLSPSRRAAPCRRSQVRHGRPLPRAIN